MKKTLLFIFSLLTLSLLAQDIKFDVLSNAGGRISNVNSASFTIGQPFVGTKSNATNSIRQGFQQPSFMMGIPGCMDSLACNYNPLATFDDGSCVYPTSSTTTITACDSLVWNGTTYNQSGTYSYSGNSGSNNYSMSFDGINDFVGPITNPGGYSNSFTINAWINKTSNTGSYDLIFSGGCQDFYFGVTSSGILQIGKQCVGGAMITGSTNVNDGNWHFVSATYNGTNLIIYLDGQIEIIDSPSWMPVVPGVEINIGRATQNTVEMFKGNISEVEFWDIALSQQDIQNYMNCSPTGSESGLIGYWNFEEGSGNTALDLSGNGNNGTINGSIYDTNVPSQSCVGGLTNANGCDSTAILNLTINNSVTTTDTITICD